MLSQKTKNLTPYLSSVTLGTGPTLLPPWHWVDAEWMRNKIRKMENEMSVAVLENIAPRSFIRTWTDVPLRQYRKLEKGSSLVTKIITDFVPRWIRVINVNIPQSMLLLVWGINRLSIIIFVVLRTERERERDKTGDYHKRWILSLKY